MTPDTPSPSPVLRPPEHGAPTVRIRAGASENKAKTLLRILLFWGAIWSAAATGFAVLVIAIEPEPYGFLGLALKVALAAIGLTAVTTGLDFCLTGDLTPTPRIKRRKTPLPQASREAPSGEARLGDTDHRYLGQ